MAQATLVGRPCLFLDRDGVIVEEVNYLHRVEDITVIPGVEAAIARANKAGVAVVIVTNQAGVGRGYYTWRDFDMIQQDILQRMPLARIDATFACAYHPAGVGALAVADHDWRKPRPGMLLAAARALHVDLAASLIVGDCRSDLAAGEAAGLKQGALVLTGHGVREAPLLARQPLPALSAQVHADAPAAIHHWLDRLTAPAHAS